MKEQRLMLRVAMDDVALGDGGGALNLRGGKREKLACKVRRVELVFCVKLMHNRKLIVI